MPEFLGKKLNDALCELDEAGYKDIEVVCISGGKLTNFDSELVLRVKLEGDCIQLLTTRFLLNI